MSSLLLFQRKRAAGGRADFSGGFRGVGIFGIGGPDRAGPSGISFAPPHDVKVHLADLVADAGDIEFGGAKMIVHEFGGGADKRHDFVVVAWWELMEVLDLVADFWHDEDPRKDRVVFEQDLAAISAAQWKCSGSETGMKSEGHDGEGSGRDDFQREFIK
jgi:hypothetical protein